MTTPPAPSSPAMREVLEQVKQALSKLDAALSSAWRDGVLPASVVSADLVREYRAALASVQSLAHQNSCSNSSSTSVDTSPSALQQQEAGSGWQPIESAPKDGKPILLFEAGSRGGTFVGHWLEWRPDPIRSGWATNAGHNLKPTHWQLLPPPPGASAPSPALQQEGECPNCDPTRFCTRKQCNGEGKT